ncbi:MAG: hypothetical protein AAB907_01520, partial [Patescibacteria group bacterium]
MSIRRILAMNRRYFYTLVHNYDRLSDSIYWPLMDLLIWGLTGLYFAGLSENSEQTWRNLQVQNGMF